MVTLLFVILNSIILHLIIDPIQKESFIIEPHKVTRMFSKQNRHIISGIILVYFGVKDYDDFHLLYNGVALAFGIYSFVLAFTSSSDEEKGI